MPDHPLVVEAKGWPQPPHLARRSYIQYRSVIQLLFGFVILGFAIEAARLVNEQRNSLA